MVVDLGESVKPRALIGGDTLLVEVERVGENEDGSLELALISLANPDSVIPITQNDWNDHAAKVSADGRYVAWISEEFGHYRSYAVVLDRLEDRRARIVVDGRVAALHFQGSGEGLLVDVHGSEGRETQYVDLMDMSQTWSVSRSPLVRTVVAAGMGLRIDPESETGSRDGSR